MSTEKQYAQAFNNGYVLAKYEPDLSTIFFLYLSSNTNYLEGMHDGKKQWEFERANEQIKLLNSLRTHFPNNTRSQELP